MSEAIFIASVPGAFNASEDTLRVTVPNVTPYVMRTPVPGGFLLLGPIAALVDIIARATKMKILVVNQDATTWGFKVNGSYFGYTGLIVRGESDVFVGPVMPTVERLEISEVTAPYTYAEMVLLTRKPGKYVDPFAFATSFSLEVWISIFFSLLFITSMLTLDKCVRKKDTKDLLLRFGSCLWLSCTYFFTSAKHKRAKNVSTRIMLATWSFSVFIVVVLLSSRLVSTMLVKSTEDHVDALEDVLRFPKLKILAERGTAFDDFLMKPKTAFFKQIQRQVELVAGIIVPAPQQDAFFDRVERGSHVVLHEQNFQDAILARRFAERGRCRFRRAGQSLRLQPLAMILWNGLKPQVKKTITTMMRRASEMALPERPMQRYTFNASNCFAEDPDEAAAYRIEDLQGAFVSLALGLSLSLAVFVTEMAAKKSSS